MSKEIVSNGESMVVEFVDRGFGGSRAVICEMSGTDGSVNLGMPTDGVYPIAIDADGVLSVTGTAVVSTLSGDLTAGGTITMASGKDIVAAGGASDLDFSASSGVFKTPTGQTTLSGAVSLASGKDIVAAGGASDIDFSLSSGVLKTPTGLTTVGGDLVMSAGKIAGFGTHQLIIAAGATAANVTTRTTRYDLDTANDDITSTLADGTQVGQRKTLVLATVQAGKTVVITPTNFSDGSTITLTNKFDAIELEWITGGWRVCSVSGAVVA